MYVLTRRFSSLPLENGCIELAGGVLTFSERCQGRYLVAKRGVYPSSKPVKAVEELYIAEGLPLRVDLVAGKAEESLRLFQNFVKGWALAGAGVFFLRRGVFLCCKMPLLHSGGRCGVEKADSA
jgi:hypothetical protein